MGGSELILIVEDDAMVRKYVRTQIEGLGYATLAAANAAEALEVIDANAQIDRFAVDRPGARRREVGQLEVIDANAQIDLLFTDVIMPGAMNGRQLVDEALKRRPGLKTLFTSGYTENAIVHHGRLDSGVLLLAKPYRKSELARMIRMALGG